MLELMEVLGKTVGIMSTVVGGFWVIINKWIKAQEKIVKLKNDIVTASVNDLKEATEDNKNAIRQLERTTTKLDKTVALYELQLKQQNIEMNKTTQTVESYIKKADQQLLNFRYALDNGEVIKVGKDTYMFKALRRGN